ncbi:MAG: TIGR02569 family protein [Nocardioides sp.]
MTRVPPPVPVREAFGVGHVPEQLPGGFSGTAWRAGDAVLKQVAHADEHAWLCEVYDAWSAPEVRVPQPLRTAAGDWCHGGWGAHVWLPGETSPAADDPDWFRAAHTAFHAAIAGLDPPAFVATREDGWSHGDRVAWDGAEPLGSPETLTLLARALPLRRSVDLPSQVVHGDLGGNVLRHPGLPPAVIDWPPYVRPIGWALAVAAMDAVCFGGADANLLDRWSDEPGWDQLLLRALVYRAATRGHREAHGVEPFGSDGYTDGRALDLVRERLR